MCVCAKKGGYFGKESGKNLGKRFSELVVLYEVGRQELEMLRMFCCVWEIYDEMSTKLC